jgi:hypothetical protein
MSVDPRCQDPHYMAFMASTLQHLQLQRAIKVHCRFAAGDPTVAQVVQQFTDQQQPGRERLRGDKVWGFMEGLRGTAAYWAKAGKDCFAMHDALGPATLFLTLSADDLHWDDLAISLWNSHLARQGLPILERYAGVAHTSVLPTSRICLGLCFEAFCVYHNVKCPVAGAITTHSWMTLTNVRMHAPSYSWTIRS